MNAKLPRLPLVLLVVLAALAYLWSRDGAGQLPAIAAARNAGAAVAGAPADVSSADADRLLAGMRQALEAHPSIVARLRQRIDLYGEPLLGTGRYVQAGRGAGLRTRLSLRLQVGDEMHSRLEVCDGRRLWIDEQGGEEHTVSRVDLDRVRAETGTGAAAAPIGARRPFEVGQLGTGFVGWLDALAESFEFNSVEASRLGGLPVTVLRGTWKGGPPDEEVEGGLLPDSVLLVAGRDDLFPYLVEFRRRQGGRSKTIVQMELFEIRLNAAVKPTEFVFAPGEHPVNDRTDETIERIRRAASKVTADRGARRR